VTERFSGFQKEKKGGGECIFCLQREYADRRLPFLKKRSAFSNSPQPSIRQISAQQSAGADPRDPPAAFKSDFALDAPDTALRSRIRAGTARGLVDDLVLGQFFFRLNRIFFQFEKTHPTSSVAHTKAPSHPMEMGAIGIFDVQRESHDRGGSFKASRAGGGVERGLRWLDSSSLIATKKCMMRPKD
jgi:hypothetical protein